MSSPVDIPHLAEEFSRALPALDARQQRVMVALYRLLAERAPVAAERLAARAGLPLEDVVSALGAFPGLERDDGGRVVGAGLTLEPTPHAVEVDGVTLYAWCALDTLLLPLALGRTARVRSASPAGGGIVDLTIDAAGVRDITPPGAVLTLVHPSGSLGDDVRGRFCCFVHFFPSAEAAQPWTGRVEGAFVVSVHDGAQLGRLLAEHMFGTAFGVDA